MSSYLPLEYVEYRGVNGLVAAEVLQDDKDGFITGDVFAVAGVAEISKSTNQSTEAHYYDNYAAVVVDGQSTDQITISASAIPLDVLAYITGQYYDTATAAMITSKTETKYFAIGYQYQNTKRENIYCWRYKGTFAVPDRTVRTLDNSTDANGQELVYTGIPTKYRFEKTGKPAKAINVEIAKGLVDVTAFFDEVTTPDNLDKDDDMDRVILDANNDFVLSDADKAMLKTHVEDGRFKVFVKTLNNRITEVPLTKVYDDYAGVKYLTASGVVCPPQTYDFLASVDISISNSSFSDTVRAYIIPIDNESTITIVCSTNYAPTFKGYFFPYVMRNRYVWSTGIISSNNFKIFDRSINQNTGLPDMTSHYEYTISSMNEQRTRIVMTRTQVSN